MGYDEPHGIVMAAGTSKCVQADYILRADQITFYQKDNLVHAIAMSACCSHSRKCVYFAEHVELTGDMKMWRSSASSVAGLPMIPPLPPELLCCVKPCYYDHEKGGVFSRVTYWRSGKDPFWQLKSHDVKVDDIRHKSHLQRCRDGNEWRTRILYALFCAPAPDADAQSGFLIPEYCFSGALGTMIRVPYYWRVSTG